MDIIINETGETKTLEMIDPRTGNDCVVDFIGNHGGFAGDFNFDNDHGVYRCDAETYRYWSQVIADNDQLEHRIADLVERYGDAVYNVVSTADDGDLEYRAKIINNALDAAFDS